ncbi:ABC transporter permease [Halalkalicoccus jeotgali]|uniref:Binding-protein-dependent transport systems inner membrane component n=1 Tax=Halalkalicoccus jeotgali (strain DSM 18796 / CECT 7217 / JCM 14584 / KCTC 4019 / B3) TaxID=795797 RepID=D8J7D6_HALJB|nr:iron ABC transporter permease [Halalkalicoccus jeotgali]ADJ14031.1 binding-protein-dependent transport systems inner membrane component [Halalkalicoccus jeotgali B3]ELY33925.1 binding-protein-dependent transport systems inner membrane component [Halalkalicoccus jeotgali B3]
MDASTTSTAGDDAAESDAPEPTDCGRVRRARDALERRTIALLAVGTTLVLALLFYYPVTTVFVESLLVEGRLTLSAFGALLRDPFYFGDLARLFAGDSPFVVGRALLSGERRLGIVGFTAFQAALSTLASLALGLPAAYVLARYEFRGRRTLRSLTILPFVLPSIMVAIGFVATFGRNGTLNAVLGTIGLGPVDLLFTLEAVVIAHAFYNAPLVARVTTAAWESVDARTVETARSLGASPIRAFRDVIAPQLYPAVVMGAALTFVFTFGTFPIILALGGFELATVEVFVYQLVGDLNYTEAAALAIVELAISLGVLYAYLRYEARHTVRSQGVRPLARAPLVPSERSVRALLARFGIGAYALVALVVFVAPIASMLYTSVAGPDGLTLDHYRFLLDRQATGAAFQVRPWDAIRNSLVFALGALALSVPMGVVISVLTTRRYRGRKLVDTVAMAPLAVSGVIVGIGLLRGPVFGVEIAGWRLSVGGALAIVAAHAVSCYPFVVRTVSPGFESLDGRFVESARALGASRVRALLDIELPLVRPGVIAGAAFATAISIGEFSSTVVLATGTDQYTMPVAIEQFIGRRLGPATAMGVVLLLVSSASFVIIDRLGGETDGL